VCLSFHRGRHRAKPSFCSLPHARVDVEVLKHDRDCVVFRLLLQALLLRVHLFTLVSPPATSRPQRSVCHATVSRAGRSPGPSTTPEHHALDAARVLHVLRDCGPCISVSCLPTAAVSSPPLLPAGRPCPWSTATHDARHPQHAQLACRPCLNQLVARHEDFRSSTTPTSYLHWCPQHLKLASPIVYVGLRASPHTATDFSSMRRLSVHHPRKNKLHPAEAHLVSMTRTTH
jgi:hypothetical protein